MTTETTGNATSAPAQQGVAGVSDGNSELDNLLREHSESSQTATQPTANVSEMSALTQEVRELRKERTQDRERDAERERDEGLKKAVAFLREPDDAKAASETLAQGFIYGYANDHAEFTKAFDERSQNPDAWRDQLKAAQDGFVKEVKSFGSDPGIIDDIEAAEAAVSGSTTETKLNGEDDGPTPAQKSRMSPREWEDYLAKAHGYVTQ